MLCLTKWKRGTGPVNPGFSLSIAESSGPDATYQFRYFDEQGGTEGTVKAVQPLPGAKTLRIEYWLQLIADLPTPGTVVKEYGLIQDPGSPSDYQTSDITYFPITVGEGYWQDIRLYHSVDGVLNIDLNAPANLTGLYTVNSADLLFANTSVHRTAVEQVIENALDNAGGYVRGTDYALRYDTTPDGGRIGFEMRHDNPGGWLGIDKDDVFWSIKPNSTDPLHTSTTDGGSGTSVTSSLQELGLCSPLNDTFIVSFGEISGEVKNYNEITYADQQVVPTDPSTPTVVCPSKRLTASITGTATAPSYSWEYNDGSGFVSLGSTTNIIDVVAPGVYRCKVTAVEGVAYDSFTVPDF